MDYDIVDKLRDAEDHLAEMREASDLRAFRRAFNACLASAKSVEYKLYAQTVRQLRKSARRDDVPHFQQWWKPKEKTIKNDPLLKWAGSARDADTHVAEGSPFHTSFHAERIHSEDMEPGPPGATSWAIGVEGAYWIVNEGTARERHVPVKFRQGTPSAAAANVLTVAVANAPAEHLGQPLLRNDPITLCRLTVKFWESLADETFKAWWPKRK